MTNTSMEQDKLVFIDTWAWLALANGKDTYHECAREGYVELKAMIESGKLRLEVMKQD